jgi:hypothetical protein
VTRHVTSRALAAALTAALVAPAPAHAWETTTHVGLAEQAALAARLDARLRTLGLSGGMFESLTVPKEDAPELLAALALHSPIHGYVPDARGRLHALGWLLAGSALADATAAWAANHFFDVASGDGWRAPGQLDDRILSRLRAARAPARGVPAPDWVVSRDNPLYLGGFLDQYEKAIKASTPGERNRHLAGALVAAGAMMHVLGDMAVPSRVRGDEDAHNQLVGNDELDRGARFERLATLAWGRLGVPAATRVVHLPTLRSYFTGRGASADAAEPGLADWTAARWFSPGTLPRPVDVGVVSREALGPALTASLARPAPAVPRRLNLMAAIQDRGATLRDAAGVCQARYGVDHGRMSWWLDDDCMLEQAAALLPVAASYEAGLLDFLLRGELTLAGEGGAVAVTVGGLALGAGTLTVLTEDGRGVRTAVATEQVAGGASGVALGRAAVPADTRRTLAVFRGVDAAGEPLVAVGVLVPKSS